MAAKTKAESPSRAAPQGRKREIAGVVMLAFGLFAGLSMLSMQLGAHQMMGRGGAATASGLYALGGMAGYLFVAGLLVMAVRCFRGLSFVDGPLEGLGAVILLVAAAVLLHLPFTGAPTAQHGPGGLLGQWMGEVTASFIGVVGAALAASTALVVALLLVTEIRPQEVAVVLGWALRGSARAIAAGLGAAWRVTRAAFPERDAAERAAAERAEERARSLDIRVVEAERRAVARDALSDAEEWDDAAPTARDVVPGVAEEQVSEGVRVGEGAHRARRGSRGARGHGSHLRRDGGRRADRQTCRRREAKRRRRRARGARARQARRPSARRHARRAHARRRGRRGRHRRNRGGASRAARRRSHHRRAGRRRPERARLDRARQAAPPADAGGRPTELLEYLPPQGNETDKQGLYEMAERLEQAMANYGVRGKVKEIHMGPVVTMYEFAPAPGTRTGKIANLEKDLAMALEAQAVRIVAPIPGKAVVGVEVPNKTREMVYLKEILEDECFTRATSKLQIGARQGHQGRARQREPGARCRTCWSPARPARASRSRSTA